TWSVKVTNPDGKQSNAASFQVAAPASVNRALGVDVGAQPPRTVSQWQQIADTKSFAIVKATDGLWPCGQNPCEDPISGQRFLIDDGFPGNPVNITSANAQRTVKLLLGVYHFARPYFAYDFNAQYLPHDKTRTSQAPGFLQSARDEANFFYD